MARNRWTKEAIVTALREQAKRLGKNTLTATEAGSVVAQSTITAHFGNVGNALVAAGLQRSPPHSFAGHGAVISEGQLFASLLALEHKLGREPGHNDYQAHGEYSVKPLRKRYGPKWRDVLSHYSKWKGDRALRKRTEPPGQPEDGQTLSRAVERIAQQRAVPEQSHATVFKSAKTPQLYGEPIDFRGLRHAPINEQGVVYLFGMVSRELGFYVESVQQGFPDCEGKHLHDRKRNLWAKARIEFEFRSSEFKRHGHDAEQCDVIVCWEHDWPECPLHVIELKKEILKLPSK